MTEFQAIAKGKCPQCHKGDMFTHPYSPFRKQIMHEHCAVCQMRFEVEVGFFWGALFISYALNIAESVTIAVAIFVLSQSMNPWIYAIPILIAIFFFITFNYRFGRILMLYWFGGVKYDHAFESETSGAEN